MPNLKAAKKALRQAKKRTIRNKAVQDTIKFLTKRTRKNVIENKIDQAKEYMYKAQQALDKAAKHGVIKKNTASRTKSRLMKTINSASK